MKLRSHVKPKIAELLDEVGEEKEVESKPIKNKRLERSPEVDDAPEEESKTRRRVEEATFPALVQGPSFEELIKEEDLTKIKTCSQDKNALPFPSLKSRIITAQVLMFLDRQSSVIQLMQVISRRGRTYIITQEGLHGFLLTSHNNPRSWLYELEVSDRFKDKYFGYLGKIKLDTLSLKLSETENCESKETYLK